MPTRRRLESAEELNLVPIMNLVTIIIPFLLMAAQFVSLAVIDAVLPSVRPPEGEEDVKPVDLTVNITPEGFRITGQALAEAGLKSELALPCRAEGCPDPASYDVAGLRSALLQVKQAVPEREAIVLAPDAEVPFEVLILALDASREAPAVTPGGKPRPLFPVPVISAGRERSAP